VPIPINLKVFYIKIECNVYMTYNVTLNHLYGNSVIYNKWTTNHFDVIASDCHNSVWSSATTVYTQFKWKIFYNLKSYGMRLARVRVHFTRILPIVSSLQVSSKRCKAEQPSSAHNDDYFTSFGFQLSIIISAEGTLWVIELCLAMQWLV